MKIDTDLETYKRQLKIVLFVAWLVISAPYIVLGVEAMFKIANEDRQVSQMERK